MGAGAIAKAHLESLNLATLVFGLLSLSGS